MKMSTMYFDPSLYPESTVVLTSMNGTFSPKRAAVPEGQSIFMGRLMDNNDVATVPRFNSKVVSRQHCVLSQPTVGRWQIKDAGSSSGTFLQNQRFGDQPYRLSEQGKESSLFELHDGDIIQMGEDYVTNGVTHKCIKIQINLPNPTPQSTLQDDGDYVDYTNDPDVRREVENEFTVMWESLTSPLVFGKLNHFTPQSYSYGTLNSHSGSYSANSPSSSWLQNQSRKFSADNQQAPTTPVGSAPTSNVSSADAGVRSECITFIRQLQWDSNEIRDRLVMMVEGGDAKILGFYRSLKQFPSAFKDVVTKHAMSK